MKHQESVFDTLDRSNASLLADHQINQHFRTAHWSNDLDRVSYHADKVHTLSFYVKGGEGSRRIDVNKGNGHTGSLCIFPQFHESQWEITSEFRFAHLYFSDESIKQYASTTLDIEPRLIEIPDLTFHEDERLMNLAQQLFLSELTAPELTAPELTCNPTALAKEQQIQQIFEHILSDQRYCLNHSAKIIGGLSPAALIKTKEYIHAHYQQNIHLAELAALVDLSEFHFLRMFKASTGFTPNDYLMHVRIEAAKQAIKSNDSLVNVALNCGFSNQSHMNRTFKKWVGVTPGMFRKLTKSS